MDFVKNLISKFSRKDNKEVDFKNKWWDSKHVMVGKDLCKWQGHTWKETTDEHLGICEVCGEYAVK